ncbi:MAG: response regulator [Alphaproteobacteria bacterium]|nr:response regulator [Alphaproteobacteria bacterium]
MTSPTPIIHVVDDDASFRTSMSRLLVASGYQTAIYASARAFLEKLPVHDAGCILLDLHMPDVNGFELQKHLAESCNVLPIVFVTAHGDIKAGVQAIKAGAEDFLPKPVAKDALFQCVERALVRNAERRQQQDRLRSMRALVASFTPREAEVFALVVRGKLNKQIAHELGTTVRTIKAHRQAGMDKLGVKSFAEAVSIAERLGMLSE